MAIGDVPYFAFLRERLDFLGERQKLIAENIANASTPDYVPRDLDTGAFDKAMAQAMRNGGPSGMKSARVLTRPDSETTLDGNAVVLEDQAMRAMETRQQFETAIALYQKGLQLVRLAAKTPR